MLESAIAIILVLGLLIFFHELGHFIVARAFRVGVSTFSLGFGPKLFGFRRGKTEYRLSAVPLGGYVHLVGESEESELPQEFTQEESFARRPAWQRLMVVAAGPVFNFLLAWFIYWGLFLGQGQTMMMPEIGEVLEDSPAYEAGIQAGDEILRVNQEDIQYWSDLVQHIQLSPDETLVLEIQRNSQILEVAVQPEMTTREDVFGEEVSTPQVGIMASGESESISLGFLESGKEGLVQTGTLIKLTVEAIIKLIERALPLDTLGGPIMIGQLVSEQTQEGMVNLLALTALISINLGLVNLLPIPVLDGGHILFYTIEIIFRRPVNQRVRNLLTRIGILLILSLMAFVIINDILRIVQ